MNSETLHQYNQLYVHHCNVLNDIVRISYALHLMLVFPVIFFSLRFNLDDLFFPSAKSLEFDKFRFSLITTGLIFLLYVAANFVPSIWDVFQFTGATATVCLGFIFPAAIALRYLIVMTHECSDELVQVSSSLTTCFGFQSSAV
ncbi:amino acid transporter, partial [Trifolium pratense]